MIARYRPALNSHCMEAEQDQDLSPEGIIRRRAQVGQQALSELTGFKALQTAEKAVADNVAHLEERMVALPKPTANVPGSVSVGQASAATSVAFLQLLCSRNQL
jgi:hypothetical protein